MASPLELATLAALINPAGCRSGGSNDALLHAMALLEESAALLREMGPMSRIERINLLHERFLECVVTGKDGASHLLRALADPIVNEIGRAHV